MKKITLLIAFTVFLFHVTYSQINWSEYTHVYQTSLNKEKVLLITALKVSNDPFWVMDNEKAQYEYSSSPSEILINQGEKKLAIATFDYTDAHFFVRGVNKVNAYKYEFRVLENRNKTIIPWSRISKFTPDTGRTPWRNYPMAYIGGYKTKVGNIIFVDVRRIDNGKIISSAIIEWVRIKPILLNIYKTNELNDFLNRLKIPGSRKLSVDEVAKWTKQYPKDQLDSITSLPKKLKLDPANNSLIFYLRSNINNKKQVEYELVKDEKVIRSWGENEFDNGFIWLKNLTPGEYLLKIRYTIQREGVTEYPFVIETAWYQSVMFKNCFRCTNDCLCRFYSLSDPSD